MMSSGEKELPDGLRDIIARKSSSAAQAMRVLFLCGSLGNGGATGYVATKAAWLRAAGAEVLVVSAGGPGASRIDTPGLPHRIVKTLARPACTASWRTRDGTIQELVSLAREYRPSIIEAAWPTAAEYGELLSAMIDVPLLVVELYYHLNRKRFIPLVEKWAGNGQLVLAFDDALRSIEQVTGIDMSRCPVLRIPVVVPETPLPVAPPRRTEHALVATVSRLDLSKRYLEHLVTQVVSLGWPGPVTLRVIGGGNDRARLERIAARVSGPTRNIEFVGMSFDLSDALRGAHVFVGQGTAAVQAAGLGLPVVLSGVNSEPATSPGLFGESTLSIGDPFPGQTSSTYQDRIERLLDDVDAWHSAARSARAAAMQHFDVERVMVLQLHLYSDLIARWPDQACRTSVALPRMGLIEAGVRRAWDSVPPRFKSALVSRR